MIEQLFLVKEYIVPQPVMILMAYMANEIMIDGVVIGYIYDNKMTDIPVKYRSEKPESIFAMNNKARPLVKANLCPAFSGQECSYYDCQCPYCGNTVECQRGE
jgi:hypothetical protein